MATAKKKTRKLKSLKHIKKLSTLLSLALRDLRKQERAKNSRVEMWEVLRMNGDCVACAAGSVMRFTLGANSTVRYLDDDKFDRETRRRLCAIDALRRGDVSSAAVYMDLDFVRMTTDPSAVPVYDGPRGGWWKAMRKLLADLKAASE